MTDAEKRALEAEAQLSAAEMVLEAAQLRLRAAYIAQGTEEKIGSAHSELQDTAADWAAACRESVAAERAEREEIFS